MAGTASRKLAFTFLNADKSRARVDFTLAPAKPVTLAIGATGARLDGLALAPVPVQPSFTNVLGQPGFVKPRAYRPADFPMLRSKDVLKRIVEGNEYR